MILLLVACGPGVPPRLGDDSAPPTGVQLGGRTAERKGPRNQQYHFVDIDLGWFGGCGLTDEGEIVCWGYSEYGILDSPSGTFTSISVGGTAACALAADGVVTCWGGQLLVRRRVRGPAAVRADRGRLPPALRADDGGRSAVLG